MPFSFMELESISGSYLLSAEDPASSFLSTATWGELLGEPFR
jgi:hypothetical protein